VRGRLSVVGVTRDDVGTASNFEPSKGTASDALKRVAVMFGIGRYLYSHPAEWVTLDSHGHVPDATLATIRKQLARRSAAS
jgi:hypothetical protein